MTVENQRNGLANSLSLNKAERKLLNCKTKESTHRIQNKNVNSKKKFSEKVEPAISSCQSNIGWQNFDEEVEDESFNQESDEGEMEEVSDEESEDNEEEAVHLQHRGDLKDCPRQLTSQKSKVGRFEENQFAKEQNLNKLGVKDCFRSPVQQNLKEELRTAKKNEKVHFTNKCNDDHISLIETRRLDELKQDFNRSRTSCLHYSSRQIKSLIIKQSKLIEKKISKDENYKYHIESALVASLRIKKTLRFSL